MVDQHGKELAASFDGHPQLQGFFDLLECRDDAQITCDHHGQGKTDGQKGFEKTDQRQDEQGDKP